MAHDRARVDGGTGKLMQLKMLGPPMFAAEQAIALIRTGHLTSAEVGLSLPPRVGLLQEGKEGAEQEPEGAAHVAVSIDELQLEPAVWGRGRGWGEGASKEGGWG